MAASLASSLCFPVRFLFLVATSAMAVLLTSGQNGQPPIRLSQLHDRKFKFPTGVFRAWVQLPPSSVRTLTPKFVPSSP